VEGVDITVPVYNFSETHYLPAASISGDYKASLFNLTGKVNAGSFKGFADQSLRGADRADNILVMTNREGRITLSRFVHEIVCAEVAISHPQIMSFDRLESSVRIVR
jgi:hypothetical protein